MSIPPPADNASASASPTDASGASASADASASARTRRSDDARQMIRRILEDGNISVDETSLILEPPRALDPTSSERDSSYYSHKKNKEESYHFVCKIDYKSRIS